MMRRRDRTGQFQKLSEPAERRKSIYRDKSFTVLEKISLFEQNLTQKAG